MSIFKKLFAKNASEDKSKELRPRPPRVQVTPLHRISFRPEKESAPLELINVSVGGMAILRKDAKTFTKDATISGVLHVDKEELAIEARIRHLTQVMAGCEFIGENVALKRAIEKYLRVEILALTLTKVADAYLKTDPRGKVLWMTDGRQNEFHCVLDDQGVLAFHLSFLGSYVDGGREQAPRVGSLNDQVSETPAHKGSTLIQSTSPEVTRETLALARVFIQNVDRVPQEIRDQVIKILSIDQS